MPQILIILRVILVQHGPVLSRNYSLQNVVQVNHFCKCWKCLYNRKKKGGQQSKLQTYDHILSLIVFNQGHRLTHAGEGRLSKNVFANCSNKFAVWTAVLVFIFGHSTFVRLAPSSSSLCELRTLYSFFLCIVKRKTQCLFMQKASDWSGG